MAGNGIAEQDDQLSIDREEVLAAIELCSSGGIQPMYRNSIAHDLTPSNLGVFSLTPSARSSSVVCPIVSTMRPPAGTDSMYSCASWS